MKIKLILTLGFVVASITGFGQYKEGYYDAMNGKQKEALKAAAKACVSSHTRLEYYPLPDQWRYTDTYPELYNGEVRWWEMYSNNIFLIRNGQSPTSSFSANRMQREHSVPKSWWKDPALKDPNNIEYTPAYTDLWNLYPSDGTANQAKNNYAFGEVADGKATFNNGSAKVGAPAPGFGGGSALVFEPADEYKGDFARTIFYMATVYDDIAWTTSTSYNMFQKNPWPTLKTWAFETMLEWHRQDPVSQKEIDRNNAVESQQHNRNPFIDFPNLAEYIWGSETSKVFYIADQGNAQLPYPDQAYLEQPVNGEALDFGQCALGGTVTSYLEIHGMITEDLSISLSGADASMFKLEESAISPSQLNYSKKYLFPITFTPMSQGEKTASLLLFYGGLEGSVRVQLRGEAVETPTLTRLTAYEPTQMAEDSYVANWSVAPEVVDYYVVTRTIYGADGTETEMLESDVNSLQIMRQEDVMESYSVQSSRLGFLSEKSNTITVAPWAGIFTAEAEYPFEVKADATGFTIVGGLDYVDARVYDLQGRLVFSDASLAPGTHVSLPSGFYLLSSSLLNRSLRILIP